MCETEINQQIFFFLSNYIQKTKLAAWTYRPRINNQLDTKQEILVFSFLVRRYNNIVQSIFNRTPDVFLAKFRKFSLEKFMIGN